MDISKSTKVFSAAHMKKIIRISTVPISLNTFCKGLLRELSHDYEVVAISSPGAALNEIEQREKVRTIAVPMRRHIAPLHDLLTLWRLFWVFRRERPDMVHSITPKAGLLAMMAAKLAGVPVRLHTFTGLIWPTARGAKRKLLLAMDKLLCACATHLNPEGQGVANDLQTARITSKPLMVLGYGNVRGIDFSFYQRTEEIEKEAKRLRLSLGLSPETFLFLFVGRLVKDKGIGELVAAFRDLSHHNSDIALLLVGNEEPMLDPLPPTTQQLIATLPNVHHLAHQTDVRPCYAAAQCLVFPSYREGFPNVVLEAGAFSLPSIVTDINGSREIITDGQNGLIVPSHDSEILALAMTKLIEDSLRSAMGAAALKNVKERFAQPFVWDQLKKYYKTILS